MPNGDLQTSALPLRVYTEASATRSPGLPRTAPLVAPIGERELERLVEFVQSSGSVAVLTGAGCSTESNIPDYRGPQGAYSTGFKPMTHQKVGTQPARGGAHPAVPLAHFYPQAKC